jgi:hypothetical protein
MQDYLAELNEIRRKYGLYPIKFTPNGKRTSRWFSEELRFVMKEFKDSGKTVEEFCWRVKTTPQNFKELIKRWEEEHGKL